MKAVDDAILGTYLGGANTRRIRKALEPLLGTKNLSKSAVSRIVGRLKALYAEWRQRDLAGERYAVLFLDAIYLKVRMARRVISVPVLAALGVQEDGQKVLVALEIAASESSQCWGELMASLIRRGLPEPMLLVTDGHAGLSKALQAWPEARVQRCTQHKWQNLVAHCPKHAHGELKRDWNAIIHAKDPLAAREAYDTFLAKWKKICPPVARSLEEAGKYLMTFYEYPKAMWKGLRSTNTVENLNREFRRRTKTQASFGTEEAALTLLYGLVAFRHIDLRRITGYKHVAALMKAADTAAA
jgi:putative transposase